MQQGMPDDQYFIDRAEHDAHADDYRPDDDDADPFGNTDPGPCCRACGNALKLTCEDQECVCHAGRVVDVDAVDRAVATLATLYGPGLINGIDPYVLVTDVLRAALFPETIQCSAPCPTPQEHPIDPGQLATFLCTLPAGHADPHHAGMARWPLDRADDFVADRARDLDPAADPCGTQDVDGVFCTRAAGHPRDLTSGTMGHAFAGPTGRDAAEAASGGERWSTRRCTRCGYFPPCQCPGHPQGTGTGL